MVLTILEKYFKISNIKNEDQVSKIKNLIGNMVENRKSESEKSIKFNKPN